MDLFVMNRYGQEKLQITEEQEKAKLERIQRQIERKKLNRIRQREREREKKTPSKIKKPETEKSTENSEIEPEETTQESAPKSEKRKLDVSSFTILGSGTTAKKIKTDRVLPQWLANPTIISTNLKNLSEKASTIKNLDKSIRKKLKENGVKYLFPVQSEVIPWLLQCYQHRDVMIPRDICVSAPTGSGKTLAFVLPVIQALKNYSVRKIRALVILPTQDLAEQIFKTFKIYTGGTNLEVGLVTGKHVFSAEQKQIGYLSESFGDVSKVDILVCTAGRLVGHLKMTEGFSLKFLEFLIIDEADRVLESVQDDWLYHLEEHVDNNRKILNLNTLKQRALQKLLFSATLTQDPEKIEKLSLFQPKLFSCENSDEKIGKFATPDELTEQYIACSKDLKPLVLYKFIKNENLTKTIIFTHSVETTHRLKILLQSLFKSKLKIDEISSNLKGKNRDLLISNFAKGDIDLLICTDFLARGIDLPGVKCVVSYSAPKFLKTYIHRVGRTARAGERGVAVTLVHNEQVGVFKNVLLNGKEIEEVKVDEGELEDLSKRYTKALNKLKETVMKEEKEGRSNVIAKKKAVNKGKKERGNVVKEG